VSRRPASRRQLVRASAARQTRSDSHYAGRPRAKELVASSRLQSRLKLRATAVLCRCHCAARASCASLVKMRCRASELFVSQARTRRRCLHRDARRELCVAPRGAKEVNLRLRRGRGRARPRRHARLSRKLPGSRGAHGGTGQLESHSATYCGTASLRRAAIQDRSRSLARGHRQKLRSGGPAKLKKNNKQSNPKPTEYQERAESCPASTSPQRPSNTSGLVRRPLASRRSARAGRM